MILTSSQTGNVGPITIKEYGQDVTRYVISGQSDLVSINDSRSIIFKHNSNIQIAKEPLGPDNKYTPDIYVEYKLTNATISFNVDISTISCSCNAAIYFVSAPGYFPNGTLDPTNNYYCGANDGADLCWEMDLMESNIYATQITPHQCDNPPGGYIDKCDGRGCYTNSYLVDENGMCPNSEKCKINTLMPYKQSVYFGADIIHTKIEQGDNNRFEFDVCGQNKSYVGSMSQAYEYGMVMVMSYWGDDYQRMTWLDGMTGCTGNCDVNGTFIVSDIEIN